MLAALLLLPGCGAPAYDPAKPHAPAAPTVVPAGDPAAPQYVALTFDDGPSPRCTPRLLDGLAEYAQCNTSVVKSSPVKRRLPPL